MKKPRLTIDHFEDDQAVIECVWPEKRLTMANFPRKLLPRSSAGGDILGISIVIVNLRVGSMLPRSPEAEVATERLLEGLADRPVGRRP